MQVADDETVVHYIDLASVRKSGTLRRVRVINDFKLRNKDGEMSFGTLNEFNCKERRTRILSLSTYSGPMAEGRVLVSGAIPGTWHSIAADTHAATILQIVCAEQRSFL